MKIVATISAFVGLSLLLSLRFVGLYSHQAFGAVLLGGLLWAIVSRLWSHRKGRLHFVGRELRDPSARPRLAQALGRGAFWIALGASALVIFPRSAEMWGLIVGVATIAVVRCVAATFVSERTNPGVTVLMALASVVLWIDLARGFVLQPDPVIHLEPPFTGEWLVLQGGRSPMQSHHLSAYNQEYALDLMKLDSEGKLFREAQGNAMNVSWEQPLRAPIEGTIADVRDGIEDTVGLNLVSDQDAAAGNFVVIESSDHHFVVMAHLRNGSVTVAPGDVVRPGDAIGKCGNSGNTTSPHLHLQVQTHRDLWDPENRSVPFSLGASTEVRARNDRVIRNAIAPE